ncbi:MAG TPA: lysozyme inhibitor LprI family protein [bacterium]|nr:lysozyme inhibitor LprI family protein [bacterium]
MQHPIRSVIRRLCCVRLAALVLAALLISNSGARAHPSLGQHVLPWDWSRPARAYAAQESSTEDSLHRYPCPEPNRTQIELDGCAAELQKDAERHLRETYENLLARVNGGRRVALGTAQAAWASYRDRDCDAQYEAYRGGSIAPEEYGLCMAWTATARERELKRLFGLVVSPSRTNEMIACLGPVVAEAERTACAMSLYAAARKELAETYRSVLEEFAARRAYLVRVKMREAQWAWGRYRDADCELVAPDAHTPATEATRIVCLTIVTQERTRRLRDI